MGIIFYEKVSLSSPEGALRARHSESLTHSDEASQNFPIENSHEISNNSWPPGKIKQCNKIAGVTVSNCEGCWDSVICFAQERDRQNRTTIDSKKDKKKGKRESNNRSCSITCGSSRRRQSTKVGRTNNDLNKVKQGEF